MRGLTTRGVRPCLRHTNFTSSLPPVRRTILLPTPKGLSVADAFTILLPSVLTAAFVADVTAKKDRIQEWDRQIATVEQETEQLRQNQLQAWSRIQTRSVAHGARQQRRNMSTAAHAVDFEDEADPLLMQDAINNADAGVENASQDMGESTAEMQTQKRFERLIATRLALQFMLQLRAGRTNLYDPTPHHSPNDAGYLESMDYLVAELEKISLMIHHTSIETIPWGTLVPEPDRPRKTELGMRLRDLSDRYRRMEIHLPDMVMSYVRLISEYKMGPPVSSYVYLMRMLSFHQVNSAMAAMVENALWDGHQYLDSHSIANIIYRHGIEADAARLKEFLARMTKVESFPRPVKKWYRVPVNDIHIAIPQSRNPYLLTALVRAALCNQQQTIAEAYANVFFTRNLQNEYDGLAKWHLVSSFLQSYGSWGTWNIGHKWLQTAVSWTEDFVTAGGDILGRVVLRMLDFCVACNNRDAYEEIMDAAIAASIPVPAIDTSKLVKITDRMGQVRLDWIARINLAGSRHNQVMMPVTSTQIRIFKDRLIARLDKQHQQTATTFHSSGSGHRQDDVFALQTPITSDGIGHSSGKVRGETTITPGSHSETLSSVSPPMPSLHSNFADAKFITFGGQEVQDATRASPAQQNR